MSWRNTDVSSRNGFFESNGKAVLIAAGYQSGACRGANGAVRIGLSKAHPLTGERVDVGRLEVRLAVTRQVCVAEVICHDEQDVRAASCARCRIASRSSSYGNSTSEQPATCYGKLHHSYPHSGTHITRCAHAKAINPLMSTHGSLANYPLLALLTSRLSGLKWVENGPSAFKTKKA